MRVWAVVRDKYINANNASHLEVYETKEAANRYGHYDGDEILPCTITYDLPPSKSQETV